MNQKKWLRLIANHRGWVVVSIIYWIFHFLFLNTDFHVLEPDEALYAALSQDFFRGKWPIYQGKLYLEIFPLFHVLAGVIQTVVPFMGKLAGVRILTALSGYGIGLALYWYGLKKEKHELGLMSALSFWLMPLSLYYSRSGTIEFFFLSLVVWSFSVFIHSNLKTGKRNGVVSGVLFALAVLAKTPALVFILTFLFAALLNHRKYQQTLIWFMKAFFVVSLVVWGLYVGLFRHEFLYQATDLPARHLLPFFNLRIHGAVLWEYAQRLGWYLSLPLLLAAFVGLIRVLNVMAQNFHTILHRIKTGIQEWYGYFMRKKIYEKKLYFKTLARLFWYENKKLSFAFDILSFCLPALVFLYLFDYSPRYFALLMPGVALLAAHGLRYFFWKPLRWLWLLLVVPSAYLAFASTLHVPFQAMKPVIQDLTTNHWTVPIYSTIDPEKMSFYLDREVKLLDSTALKGGIIITDRRKTELFASFTEAPFLEMKTTLQQLSNKQMVWSYIDTYPHYPVTSLNNQLYIYLIPAVIEDGTYAP